MKQLTQNSNESFDDFVKRLPTEKGVLNILGNIENKVFIEGKVIVNPYKQSEVKDIANFITNKLIPFSIKNKCLVLQSEINKDNTYFIADGIGVEKCTKLELLNKLIAITMEPHDRIDFLYFGEKIAIRTIRIIKKQPQECDECWMHQPIS